eukprot:Gregarina_sp_Poly_1__8086@NODE_465_length_8170_cov_101_841787_g379_i0_p3_GENE_NODE_465_length_8170_cov_101_841787_g379_i0NODE_465_length_8170_cov_101_841787_g379_i0_p3_ORF_typecomplete_len248_score22_18_NODE_465_length_8170_cov_101_841787_g379_i031513894
MLVTTTLAAVLIAGASALKKPHLNITEIACTPGQGPGCTNQCARNGCPGAYNEATLNACLHNIDPVCSVRFKGILTVTLEKNLDFCNIAPSGSEPGGWLFNVPYMGSWQRMVNPWLLIPRTLNSGEAPSRCNYLMKEIHVQADAMPATISPLLCIDTTSPTLDQHVTVHRDFDFEAPEWAYPLSVLEWMNSFFISPPYQQCWDELQQLKFAVEIEDDLNGQTDLFLPAIVQSGTVPLTEFIQSRPRP